MDYREEFYSARWHLDAAKRMLESFDEYGGKRFLVGVIREGARSAGKIIRSFLIRESVRGNLQTFMNKVGIRYLKEREICDLVSILNLEKDQRNARVEFLKKDRLLFNINGEWRVLDISRLRELIDNIDNVINNF